MAWAGSLVGLGDTTKPPYEQCMPGLSGILNEGNELKAISTSGMHWPWKSSSHGWHLIAFRLVQRHLNREGKWIERDVSEWNDSAVPRRG